MRRLAVLVSLACGLGAAPAMACAVATDLEVRNATQQQVRRIMIDEQIQPDTPASTRNILRPPGLAPGSAVTLGMPSCMGIYVLTAILEDGTERRYRDLDARRVRALELR